MPNIGAYICPYYQTEDRFKIICEGIIDVENIDMKNNIRFANKKSKADWVNCYCETYEYNKCPYAKMLEVKYNKPKENSNVKDNRTKIIISTKEIKASKQEPESSGSLHKFVTQGIGGKSSSVKKC